MSHRSTAPQPQVEANVIVLFSLSVVIVIFDPATISNESSGLSGCIVSCHDTVIVSNIFWYDTYFFCLPTSPFILLFIFSLDRSIFELKPSSSTS